MSTIKILVVEDDMIIAADISMHLTKKGFEVTAIVPRGEAVADSLSHDLPDIVLMDVSLKGKMDGVETAMLVRKQFGIPVIFLTANSDKATFERAKEARPYAFISKPFNPTDLIRAIEVAFSRLEEEKNVSVEEEREEGAPFILEDRIFVRSKDRMVKLALSDIQYVEAESNYCKAITHGKSHLMATTLKSFEKRLKDPRFLRVHRSYIINLTHLEEVGELYLKVSGQQIPISKSHREELFQRLKTM